LAAADYPEVWAGRGYPPRLRIPRISGTIVHDVIETVADVLVAKGYASMRVPEAVQAMRDAGGFTRLFDKSTQQALRPYCENPRATKHVDAVRRNLQAHFGGLRRRAQALLMTIETPPRGSGAAPADVTPRSQGQERGPLRIGTHSEVEVIAREIGWKGKIDLLTISPAGCGIIDFKTGESSDEHAFQVRLYALLWSLDGELNPSRTLATSLTLVYADSQSNVPTPNVEALAALRMDVVSRTNTARAFDSLKPPARPSANNCTHCDVRHLCDEYWTRDVQHSLRVAAAPTDVCDGEFELGVQLGTSNWEVTPRIVPPAWKTARSVLRCSEPPVDLRSGQIVRVLDGRIFVTPDEPNLMTLNVGPSSEIYVVS
jgi:hypothetical protein